MHFPYKYSALINLILFIGTAFSADAKSFDPLPLSYWDLGRYEITGATDTITGIHDTISNRFHYTRADHGELIRYPTYVVRKAVSAHNLTNSFSIEAWVSLQADVTWWNPIYDQGITSSSKSLQPGLAGIKFGDTELVRPDDDTPVILEALDYDWSDGDKSWSGRWRGFITAPFSGDVTFTAEADDGVRLTIDSVCIIDGWGKNEVRRGTVSMEKGCRYPIVLDYYQDGGNSYLRLFWEMPGQKKAPVPKESLSHNRTDMEWAINTLNYVHFIPDEITRISFGIDDGNCPALKINTGDSIETFRADTRISLNKWTHVALTFDEQAGVVFYIDGTPAGISQVPCLVTQKKGGDVYIGRNHREDDTPYSQKEFMGMIGSIGIYDKAMNHDAIQERFSDTRADFLHSADMIEPFRHVMIYDEPGRFAAWPANGGIWSWGNEIVVAFVSGWFKDKADFLDGHSIDDEKGNEDYLSRSLDGGETWICRKNLIFDPPDSSIVKFNDSMDFSRPGYAFQCSGGRFYYSYDRWNTVKGPYKLEVEGFGDNLTTRTDYIVESKDKAYFFMSMEPEDGEDRAFAAFSADGGKTVGLTGWMCDPNGANYERWVMPSTVRLSDTHFVSALRRKINIRRADQPDSTFNWIDVYESIDTGKNWSFLSRIAETGTPNDPYNGNPPSMVLLDDGRLCVTYGVRAVPGRICAKISLDKGHSWSDEIILRQDARNWDMGYTRSVQRPDGNIVTVYYFATPENRDQFIAATIWNPDNVVSNR